jgi:methylglutaconyl-CoA hydratase
MQDRATADDPAGEWREDTQVYRDLLVELTTTEIPTIAAVQGPVLAGGVGLVLACDLVVAAEEATFSLPEPKRGITAAVVTPLLHYRAGTAAASWLLLSGETVDSARARQAGLCHEIVPKDKLEDRVGELEQSILTGSKTALVVTKRELRAVAGPSLIEQIDAAREASAKARETADAREGLQAFLEKRKPAWNPNGA